MNKLSIPLLIFSSLILTACHHDNPLKTQSPKASALFLMNASANVEQRLHFAIKKDAFGYAYLECMEGKKSPEIRCLDLLHGMVGFAKENHYPAFKKLTLADLSDKAVFEKIADDYAETAATNWPHYFPVSAS